MSVDGTTQDSHEAEQSISERKLAANQANAKKSTGPKTAKGKKRVRLNALRHGLASRFVVVPDLEDPERFRALLRTLRSELEPVGVRETLLLRQIAEGLWRANRGPRAEAGLFAAAAAERLGETFGRLLEDDEMPPKARQAAFTLPDASDLRNLARYEAAHRRQMTRALKELEVLQRRRKRQARRERRTVHEGTTA
jgi:hypothetical protein